MNRGKLLASLLDSKDDSSRLLVYAKELPRGLEHIIQLRKQRRMTTVYLFVERPIQVIGLFLLPTFTTLNKCKVISMHTPAITGRGTKRTR